MTKALVTGAAGFIGSHVSELLLSKGIEVVGVDCFNDNYPRLQKQENLQEALKNNAHTFIEANLNDLDLAALTEGVDYVFHLAGRPGVRTSWDSAFGLYLDDNVLATQRLLEAVKGKPLRKFVYASSSSIYGEAATNSTPESTTPAPISPYGTSKLAAEHLGFVYWSRFDVPVVSLRYFTVYGPGQRPDMAFHIFIKAILTGAELEVFGDGHQVREFTYVDDIVRATVLAAETAAPGSVYNVGGGHTVELADTIRLMEKITGRKAQIRYGETGPGDPRRTAADISKIKAELNWQPEVSLGEGIAKEVDWLREVVKRSEIEAQ